MKKYLKLFLSVLIALIIAVTSVLPAFAEVNPFGDDAYASVVTVSDMQDNGTKAFDRFGRVLNVMKNDGLETPDSVLIGGDFTKILFDYASPGIIHVKDQLTSVYPDADPNSVVVIQGNHDNTVSGFTKTGFYDMGDYVLYCINENDFPWKQNLRCDRKVKKVAEDMESNFAAMVEQGDTRPVIVITHIPLHHTRRSDGKDNMYASYIFNVLNTYGTKLDIAFIFGHNHSNTYDDYIGGSVNFFTRGDKIRIPTADKKSAVEYTEETLNFTYTNCGYIGYSKNTVSDTSTDVLTVGVIRISDDNLRFVKYSEDGMVMVKDVARITSSTGAERTEYPELQNSKIWEFEQAFLRKIFEIWASIVGIFA